MEITLIYPHQLWRPTEHPALAKNRPVYLVEEPLLLTYNPAHRGRLLLHRLSLRAYQTELEHAGFKVHYLELPETTATVFAIIASAGATHVHVADTTDDYLEQAILSSKDKYNLTLIRYESPLFILPKADACKRYLDSKRRMANFYKTLRQDRKILLTKTGKPEGGQWSFDAENRKKLPKDIELPNDLKLHKHDELAAAIKWLEHLPGDHYGLAQLWLPYTRDGAADFLETFLHDRFLNFGPYEDAMTTKHTRLFHSTLSPLLNIGLLTPTQVLVRVLAYADKHDVPIATLEGFVRQLIGWREFIRAAYEVDGRSMRSQNFWQHHKPVPASFWTGDTGLKPVDHSIKTAHSYGYNHHIERLMVLGNSLLLLETHPTAVYEWFMAMYVDAYDWVMVPNVYGMSQYADGGSFATKPYICGSNYIKKMSDVSGGEWEATWTALYWDFIRIHEHVFLKNHRLAMMPRLLAKMDAETKATHTKKAAAFKKILR